MSPNFAFVASAAIFWLEFRLQPADVLLYFLLGAVEQNRPGPGSICRNVGGRENIDPVPLIRERARDRFESLLKRGDASALSLATTLLTLIEQSLRNWEPSFGLD